MDNKETEARLLALYKLILSLENTLNNWVKENSALFEKTNNQPSEQTPKKQGNYEYWNHIWELIKKHNIDTKKLTKFIGCRMIELPPHALPYLKILIENLVIGIYTIEDLLKISDKPFKEMTEEEMDRVVNTEPEQ